VCPYSACDTLSSGWRGKLRSSAIVGVCVAACMLTRAIRCSFPMPLLREIVLDLHVEYFYIVQTKAFE
jgi:hypothetical protein